MNFNSDIRDFQTGRFTVYPNTTGQRLGEGGLRLLNRVAVTRPDAPLVSIITVCWNSAKTLEQTIQSVRAQTYKNIEYIIIDAASTDGTLDIIAKHDDFVDYYVSEPDDGLYFAMNKGLELAKGDYILILNSDDWYIPNCVETLLTAKAESGADFVSALSTYVDADGKFIRHQPSCPYDAGVFIRMPLRHETMLVSKDLYNLHGPYDTRYFINADRALVTQMFESGVTHFEVQKPLMFFRDTGVSSTDMVKLYAERELILSRNFPEMDAADIEALAHLHILRPNQLVEIVQRYDMPKFTRAAFDYSLDRQARGDVEWKRFNFKESFGAESKRSSAQKEKSLGGKNSTAVNSLDKSFGYFTQCDTNSAFKWSEKLPMISIATFVTRDYGGAGIGSQRRVQALRALGVQAEIFSLIKTMPYAFVRQLPLRLGDAFYAGDKSLNQKLTQATKVTDEDVPEVTAQEYFSKTASLVDFTDFHSVFDKADIVHLHWVVGMFDYDNAPEVLGKKPVVWTLADMNAFTGGCHYSEGCEGYTKECRECPLIGGSDLAHTHWLEKKKAYNAIENLQIICPSEWLAKCVKASSLLGDRPVHVIPNAIPASVFEPMNKYIARKRLGLPFDKKLILFGAENVGNLRKGGDILEESLRRLQLTGALQDTHGVVFGASELELDIETHSVGLIANHEKLAWVYAAADVFAFSSREDNAPLTVAEAMLCGTPVVGFDVGNVPELVKHKTTGYIADYLDVDDFSNGLLWALENARAPHALARSLQCHLDAKAYNDPVTSASRHIALYKEMLNQNAGEKTARTP